MPGLSLSVVQWIERAPPKRQIQVRFLSGGPTKHFKPYHAASETPEEARGCGLFCFQSVLIERPDAGPLIPGAVGLRKLRWAMPGRGKRGGAGVIYYWRTAADVVYLVCAYAKNDQEDLTPDQARQLAKLIEGVLHDE